MAQTTTPPASALGAGRVAGLSNEDLGAQLDDLFTLWATIDGRIVELLGEATASGGRSCAGTGTAASPAAPTSPSPTCTTSRPGNRAAARWTAVTAPAVARAAGETG